MTPESTLPQKLVQRINPISPLALISVLLAGPKPTSPLMSKAVPALQGSKAEHKRGVFSVSRQKLRTAVMVFP